MIKISRGLDLPAPATPVQQISPRPGMIGWMASVFKIKKSFSLFLCSLLGAGCMPSSPQMVIHEVKGEVFGSYFSVKYRGELSEDVFRVELQKFFQGFNDEFSTHQENSVITRFNRAPKNQHLRVSPRFLRMLEMAKRFHTETEGAFDPTLGPVVRAWGGGGGLRQTETEVKEAMKKVGFHHIHWDKEKVWKDLDGVQLDVNAFASGWAADLIGDMLDAHHIENFMVDINGEILFKGDKGKDGPWIGGIEKPSLTPGEDVHLALKMRDAAMATSGNSRPFLDGRGESKSQIIDPRTGAPVPHTTASATVITETAARADAWSTAMMVLGEAGLSIAGKHGIKVLLLIGQRGVFQEAISDNMKSFLEDAKL